MAAELAEARRIPLFNASVLTNLIYFPYSRKSMDKMIQILQNEPLFGKKEKYAHRGDLIDVRLFMNRRQLLAKALKGQRRLMELQKENNWDRNTLLSAVVLLDDPLPFTLHFSAFMAVIEGQGTDEQRKEWIPPSERMEILGNGNEEFR